MADESRIRQRIELEGEKEYRAALKAANRELKTLQSALKAETAELGKNATEQQKNEIKVKSLQKQIKEQEKIVRTYRDALAEVREKYGDNDEAVAKWEQKLNQARTTLANMKNSLDSVGDGLKNVERDANTATTATKSVADSLQNLAEVGGSIADSIEGIFSGMVSTVKSAIGEIWGDIMEIAGKANNWSDLAAFLGTDATRVQMFDRALQSTGNSFSTITSMISRLKYGGNANKVAEWFGISGENYTDDLQYIQAVLQQMNDLKPNMVKSGTWGTAMGEIFGQRKVQEIDSILSDWTDILTAMEEFDTTNGGIGLNGEELETMNELYNKVGLLQESWNAFKESVETKLFGGISLELTGNAQAIVNALNTYLNAGDDAEREQAISEIEDNILAMFEAAKKGIESGIELLDKLAEDLKGSENPTAKALGNILGGLVEALQWLTEDNMNNVVKALEILATFWIAGKGLEMASTIASLAANIKTIETFKGFGALTGGTGGTGGTGLLTTSGVTAAVESSAGSIATALTGVTLTVGLAALTAPVLASLKEIIAGRWPSWLPEIGKTTGETALPDASEEAQEAFEEMIKNGRGNGMTTPLKDTVGALLFGGGKTTATSTAAAEAVDDTPTANIEKYAGIPTYSERTPGGVLHGLDVTEQQKAAAEAFWDVWKDGDYSNEEFDAAYNEMTEAFEGNEKAFEHLDEMLDKLKEWLDSEDTPETLDDLPASWWRDTGTTGGNGVTSADLQGLNNLPAGVMAAVKQGAAQGVSGIRVNLDGRTVGELVAPYVSQKIAEYIV